jgi:two-component system, cell cycle response regulator
MTGSRPLTALVVSEDHVLLRRLWKFLNISGYEVCPVADRQQAAAAVAVDSIDVLIVDAEPDLEAALEICRLAHAAAGCTYTLLLVKRPSVSDLGEALDSGVDDFLTRPVVYGELLSRLRAAARSLEFERRLREHVSVDRITGLPGRSAFELQLNGEVDGDRGPATASCVLVDLDFLGRINRLHGRPVGDAVLRTMAARLSDLCGPQKTLACFGGGTFAVLLRGMSDVEASAWADCTRLALAETEIECAGGPLGVTASFGVAALDIEEGRTAADAIRRAEQALESAKTSGRKCVLRAGECDDDAKQWAEFAAPGRLFERTVARDIMTPCAATLRAGDAVGLAADLMRRSQLEALVVVDPDDKFLGLVSDQAATAGLSIR